MGLFDSIERRGVFDGELTTPEAGGVAIPLRLRDLSRKHDSVRYWVAEIEGGNVALIEGLVACIETLIQQNRSLR